MKRKTGAGARAISSSQRNNDRTLAKRGVGRKQRRTARTGKEVRVGVVDACAVFRQGIWAILARHATLRLSVSVGRCRDIEIERPGCDVLLFDGNSSNADMEHIARLRHRVALVGVAQSCDSPCAIAAFRAGARSIVPRNADPLVFARMLATATDGGTLITPALQSRLLDDPGGIDILTPREREIVVGVSHGQQSRELAAQLGVAESTVKTHLNHIYLKLGIRRKVDLTLFALRTGLLHLKTDACLPDCQVRMGQPPAGHPCSLRGCILGKFTAIS